MHSRLSFVFMALLILAGQSGAQSRPEPPTPPFTIQVASFPDTTQADSFAARLAIAGETPVCDRVEIKGRGFWTRVFLGFFDTPDAARRHGDALVERAVITEFLVKKASAVQVLTRPRRVLASSAEVVQSGPGSVAGTRVETAVMHLQTVSNSLATVGAVSNVRVKPASDESDLALRDLRAAVSNQLPVAREVGLRLAPRVDTTHIPRPDPISLAFRLVSGDTQNGSEVPAQSGGLWMTGDTDEGIARLRWIVGPENAGLISLGADGQVSLDKKLLAKVAGLGEIPVEDPLRAVDYISSNEGLLLLVQIAEQNRYRYLLHIGRYARTAGRSFETAGSINLDNNFDSRITPYRKNGRKLDEERPPEGFDSLIGLNPVARWFNLSTNSWVQGGEIVFHELAEAHAKLEFGLDYLEQGARPGAHTRALERECRLKSQRPGADIVMTTGSNRLLRTEEEIRLFYAESAAGASQR